MEGKEGQMYAIREEEVQGEWVWGEGNVRLGCGAGGATETVIGERGKEDPMTAWREWGGMGNSANEKKKAILEGRDWQPQMKAGREKKSRNVEKGCWPSVCRRRRRWLPNAP